MKVNNRTNLLLTVESEVTETGLSSAQERLLENKIFSYHLLENLPNAVLIINPDTSIQYVNPALEHLTGFSSDEIVGQNEIIERLTAYVKETADMPHFLFAGPPGVGKTSAAVALAHEILKDNFSAGFMELNASDERGIRGGESLNEFDMGFAKWDVCRPLYSCSRVHCCICKRQGSTTQFSVFG